MPAYVLNWKANKLSQLGGWKTARVIFLFSVVATTAAPAQTFTSLTSFDVTNGANPQWGPLVQGRDGNFYGTTSGGGILNSGCFRSPDGYCGTLFKVTRGGTLTKLYAFTNGKDGSGPMPGVILATDGDFYGVNTNGGNFGFCFGIGCGAAFKMSAAGTLTPLFDFTFSKAANSASALVEATNGDFYGTSVNGGISGCGPTADGCGMIFAITPRGELTVLHDFDFNDGWDPQGAALIQAKDGKFYGETSGGGGSSNCANGCGTVYRVGPLGVYEVLHRFKGTDGYGPQGGLVRGSDGNFYGTTNAGGAQGDGTVFRISAEGALTTLHSFDENDGSNPGGGLVQATDGNFYGTTYAGGANGVGTVFSLSVGLGPFVSFVGNSGVIGQTVEILGQGLTGTTAVTFNGTPAVFTVQSETYLTAMVPAGATTGFISVTDPGGTLKSNKEFRVTPLVESLTPSSGPAGTSVVIAGESLTQATEVVFACGQKASFSVDSDAQITAIVPQGAKSGRITITTPSGIGESPTPFTVTP